MNDIHIDADKAYTLPEVVDAVKQTLDRIVETAGPNELRYSAIDLYWLLYDMLRYVNRNVPGEFSLQQIRKGTYRVQYSPETTARKRSRQKLKADVSRTADYLEELTGRRPAWGDKGNDSQ